MSKTKAIKDFCKECAGSFKDSALCLDPGCPLWPHRVGPHPKSAAYRSIMDKVKARFPEDVADLSKYGLEWQTFADGLSVKGAFSRVESTIEGEDDELGRVGESGAENDEKEGILYSEIEEPRS